MVVALSSARCINWPPHWSQTPSCFGGILMRWKMAWQFAHVLRFSTRSRMIVLEHLRLSTWSIWVICSNSSACFWVRGNPSRMKPFFESECLSRCFSSLIASSSGTSCPASMYGFACFPISSRIFVDSLSKSPVLICGMLNFFTRRLERDPLPAPGGPNMIILIFSLLLSSEYVFKCCYKREAPGESCTPDLVITSHTQ